MKKKEKKRKEKVVKTKKNTVSSNDINNPQSTVSVVESTTDNVYGNNEKIVINETNKIIARKNTVTLATINNGELNVKEGVSLPPPVDLNKKDEKIDKRTGKRIKVVTFRERVANFFLTIVLFGIIGCVGYGVYYFMYLNNPANFSVKNITLQLGETLPNVPSYYVDLKDISDLDYTLDISGVEQQKIGSYQYSVSYGKTKKFGTINIVDTKYPEIIFNDNLTFNVGETITKEMIVKECNDPSNCVFELENEIYISVPGKIDVSISAKDDLGNTNIYTTQIELIEVTYKLICTKSELDNGLKYLNQDDYILNFNADKNITSNNYTNTKTYFSENLFNEDKQKNPGALIDEENKKITVKNDYLDFNGMTNYDEINNYLLENGYECQ